MRYTYDELEKKHPCYGAKKGRIHLPVCPVCNIKCRFCTRVINDYEQRPGVTSRVLELSDVIEVIQNSLDLCPDLTVVGIAGPGETLASSHALDTFRLVNQHFPNLVKCMSTNGLLLYEKADEIREVGVDSVTVTVNAIQPEIEAKLNQGIIYHGKWYEGEGSAKILLENQLKGIQKLSSYGIPIRVNTVLVPGINTTSIEEISKTVKDMGASVHNIIPLIPNAEFESYRAPNCQEIHEAREASSKHIKVFSHCHQCRADAIGIPGDSEFGTVVYKNKMLFSETFSHG